LYQLKDRYYDPGLLAKYLGHNREKPRQVEAFAAPKLHPAVTLAAPAADKPKMNLTLTNRGGGIGKVVVKINGKEAIANARPANADPNAPKLEIPLDLANDPRLVPGKENQIEVIASNAEGYLSSRGMKVVY